MTVATRLLDHLPPSHFGRKAAAAAAEGDTEAKVVLRDILEEEGLMNLPFKVGDRCLFETVTLYYVGEITEVGFSWVRLKDASWVHWTGRKGDLARHRKFKGVKFTGRNPRTEYIGDYVLHLDSVVGFIPPPWELPKESIQG